MTTALIAVDIQPDFLPGGPLGVTDGTATIPTTVRHAQNATVVIATGDGHTPDHCSFVGNLTVQPDGSTVEGIWPPHCVRDTDGARIVPEVWDVADIVVLKATTQAVDAYGGFDAPVEIIKHPDATRVGDVVLLADLLRELGVEEVGVTGLATDYCVKATALGALQAGFATTVYTDAVRAVSINPTDGQDALDALAAAGVTILT
jgi:nicotinamidase/pyrazinamidase